jgi:hypothetical protein
MAMLKKMKVSTWVLVELSYLSQSKENGLVSKHLKLLNEL